MTNKEKLFEDINPHTQYWDCYNDCSLEYNHTGKVLKIFKENSVLFSLFCAKNFSAQYFNYDKQLWFERNTGKEYTTEGLYKLWENGIIE